MSDQIHLRIGAKPWAPADSAKIDKVLNHYDVPLAGILHQHRRFYIFECLDGHGSDVSLWAYAEITRGERRAIKKTRGPEALRKAFYDVLTSRAFTAALSINESLEMAAIVERSRDAAPVKAATSAVSRKVDKVHTLSELAAC